MGKRITQQARGKGGPAYRVNKRAFRYRIGYPSSKLNEDIKIVKLISSPAHSAPLAKIIVGKDKKVYYIPAAQGIFEGQNIEIGGNKIETGNIIAVKEIPIGVRIFNIEKRPGDGGKMIRTSGGFATILKKDDEGVVVAMITKKEVALNGNCRATIGVVAGQGRLTKPIVKAGKMYYMMKARSKKWHRTSAVKMNAVDHPFGGGRGKRIKSKIAKRNAPPGARVGHLHPSKTGRGKGEDK